MGCTTSSETASGGSSVEAFCSSTRARSDPQPRRVDTNVRALALTLTLSNPLTETTEHQLADLVGQRSTPRGASSRAIGDGLRIIGVTRRPRMPPTAVPALTPLSGQSSVGNPTIHSGDPLQRSGRSSRRQSSVSTTGTTSAPDALLTAQRLHRARMLYHVEGRWAPLDPCPPPERILTATDADPALDLHDALRDMHWSLMQPQSDEEADADRRARAADAFFLQADATAAENGDAIHESAFVYVNFSALPHDGKRL
jgi:hypothetical protein